MSEEGAGREWAGREGRGERGGRVGGARAVVEFPVGAEPPLTALVSLVYCSCACLFVCLVVF